MNQNIFELLERVFNGKENKLCRFKQSCGLCFKCIHCTSEYWNWLSIITNTYDQDVLIFYFDSKWKNLFVEFHSHLKNCIISNEKIV
jgi:hypothetical protein